MPPGKDDNANAKDHMAAIRKHACPRGTLAKARDDGGRYRISLTTPSLETHGHMPEFRPTEIPHVPAALRPRSSD